MQVLQEVKPCKAKEIQDSVYTCHWYTQCARCAVVRTANWRAVVVVKSFEAILYILRFNETKKRLKATTFVPSLL